MRLSLRGRCSVLLYFREFMGGHNPLGSQDLMEADLILPTSWPPAPSTGLSMTIWPNAGLNFRAQKLPVTSQVTSWFWQSQAEGWVAGSRGGARAARRAASNIEKNSTFWPQDLLSKFHCTVRKFCLQRPEHTSVSLNSKCSIHLREAMNTS